MPIEQIIKWRTQWQAHLGMHKDHTSATAVVFNFLLATTRERLIKVRVSGETVVE